MSLLLFSPHVACADVAVEQVRVGIATADGAMPVRLGAWVPVATTLTSDTTIAAAARRFVVQTTDVDGVPFRYSVAIPAMAVGERRDVAAYTRPGSASSGVEVQITTADGRNVGPSLRRAIDVAAAKGPRVVVLGSRSLRPDGVAASDLGVIADVAQMPDRWFGYDAVDVAFLATDDADFITQLLDDNTGRRDALVEWVHRGGRLVVSVGKRYDLVEALLTKTGLLECKLRPPVTLPTLLSLNTWAGAAGNHLPRSFAVTVVKPGPAATILVQEEKDKNHRYPVIVQGSSGLGRVMLIAFDVESEPFAAWPARRDFWEKLLRELRLTSDEPTAAAPQDLLGAVQRQLETFGDVPTISFGWVALITLFYVLLVGPFDYFILKRIFRRLEMTWATLPATVVLVSGCIVLTAYALKGDQMHVNKIDVVDIDLHERTASGTTWFSVFSPQSRNYAIDVAPSTAWGLTQSRSTQASTVAVLSPADGARVGPTGLYPQPYDSADGATELTQVPIPVWAARTFTATWSADLAARPPIVATLRIPRAGERLPLGEIINNQDVALHDVAIFYRDQWYDLGTLEAGEVRAVGELFTSGLRAPNNQWFTNGTALGPTASARLVKEAMFHTESDIATWSTTGAGRLDQSWRLWRHNAEQNRDEVILIARTGPTRGPIADVIGPTNLKIDGASGVTTQETYLRVYIPVDRP